MPTVDNYQPVGPFKTIRTDILKLYFTTISRRCRYCQSIVSHIVDRQKYRSLAVLCCSFQQLQRRASFTARRRAALKHATFLYVRDSTFNNRTVVRRLLSSNQTRRRQPPAHHGHRSNGCTHRRRHRA